MKDSNEIRIHVFNPEHDIALAANQKRFTAPHAGRQMRADLGFIPALWANDSDFVIVDDVEAALEAVRHIRKNAHKVEFITLSDLKKLELSDNVHVHIMPWGWDCTIKEQLLRADSRLEAFMPDDASIDIMRQLSNRRFASEHLLPILHDTNCKVVGESSYCETEADVLAVMLRYGTSVLKSPWSSSGRGVRYVPAKQPDDHVLGWVRNILRQQGGIMVEPLYPKVYDFGMEFYATAEGVIEYRGLSLFATRGGAYTGSICATESDKREMLSHYVDLKLLDRICGQIKKILANQFKDKYVGPFGIDMMSIAKEGEDGFWLHPCVELNLRRTMGHVALALTPTKFEARRLMNIYYADKYRVRIQTVNDNLLNTGLA